MMKLSLALTSVAILSSQIAVAGSSARYVCESESLDYSETTGAPSGVFSQKGEILVKTSASELILLDGKSAFVGHNTSGNEYVGFAGMKNNSGSATASLQAEGAQEVLKISSGATVENYLCSAE